MGMLQDRQPVVIVEQLPRWSGQLPVPTVFGPLPGAGPLLILSPLPDSFQLAPGIACLHESIVCSQIVTLPPDAWAAITPVIMLEQPISIGTSTISHVRRICFDNVPFVFKLPGFVIQVPPSLS